MRIVAISDTHGRHEEIKLPEGDTLIHAGDMSIMGSYFEILNFITWFQEQPFKNKILIAGNHDFYFERQPGQIPSMTQHITYLQDRFVELDGVRFYGSPWTPAFNGWAFNLERGSKELLQRWSNIPTSTDVLITHGPPYAILDKSPDERIGCKDLLEAVWRVRPKVHIFGHNHAGYGVYAEGQIVHYNVATCDLAYQPVNAPVVIDI